MTLYALDDIQDGIAATRAFLLPFDLRRWTKLALLVFFVGGGGGVNPTQFSNTNVPQGSRESPGAVGFPGGVPAIQSSELVLLAAILGVIGLIALGLLFVGSVLEFAFVESLRNERVSVREYWSDHWRLGARLFGFRLGLAVLSLGVVGVLGAAFLLDVGRFPIHLLPLGILLVVVLTIVVGLVNAFTARFVVPIMILEEQGLLAAWRQFWPTLSGQWKQYAVYAVMRFVLQIAGGILVGLITLVGAIVLAIPLGIVGVVGYALLSALPVVGWALIGFAVGLYVLGLLLVTLFAAVPVQSYLRYYALLVLGDTNEAFDAIPERREAVRE
jgi:hypothetical protein